MKMSFRKSESPDGEYFQAVNRLRRFLSESDGTEHSIFRSGSEIKLDKNESIHESERSFSAKKCLFRSPTQQTRSFLPDPHSNEPILSGLIQRQILYIGALEKELNFYRREVPGIVNESKILISNEEASRMGQASNVTQRLFTLIETAYKVNTNHESCESQRKKLLLDLAAAQEQIQHLNDQSNSHVCWNGNQPQPKWIEEFAREKSELMNTVSKLRSTVTSLQQREQDALRQVRQSVEVAEQAQVERAQMENEVRRLAALIEQHEQQLNTADVEHSRRLQEERSRLENKLAEQMNLMKRERDLRDEALTRLSLELETCQRSEAALKNQIRLKTTLIESNRQEMQRQLNQLQGELSRSAGQQAELQRRLGEAELRVELSGKSAQQEASLTRTELEFSRRKIELLEKDIEAQKQEYERTIKELEQGNIELHQVANQREAEKVQALKSQNQSVAHIKHLEQRHLQLLNSVKEAQQTRDEKIEELSSIVQEQRSIIQTLKRQHSSLVDDFRKCLASARESQEKYQHDIAKLSAQLHGFETCCQTQEARNRHLTEQLYRLVAERDETVLATTARSIINSPTRGTGGHC